MSALRETPIYRALHRPNLILGGDRKLVLSAFLFASIMIFTGANKVGLVCGFIFVSVSLFLLRRMAKADPMMLQVYWRQKEYRDHYAPFSRPFCVSKRRNY